jgi:sulfatase maturation enzyme AslB (radical SAM superfamily)
MGWAVARSALETVLAWGLNEIVVEFTGGEPLLEVATLRRAVSFIEANRARDTAVSFTITTNGTLLTPQLTEFLLDRGFTIRLSFDGVDAAQGHRGEGTFRTLDRLLHNLREQHPSGFAKQLRIVVTLLASTIPLLAESVRYLLAKDVQAIEIAPRFTWDPDWRPSCRDGLERQVNEILRLSLDHWRATGSVPVGFLSAAPLLDADAPVEQFLCGAPAATALCVDPEGQAWACPSFAGSLQTLAPLALEASRVLGLGPIFSPRFSRRLSALSGKASRLQLFADRLGKRSSYGSCVDCRYVADCHICPASISHSPTNLDPDLIPDFACAFKYTTLAAREWFDEMTGGRRSVNWYNEVRAALGELEDAVKSSVATSQLEQSLGSVRTQRRPARRIG